MSKDFSQIAKFVVDVATKQRPKKKTPEKDAAAVELGKKGGIKRSKNLNSKEKTAIAKKAAKARWSKSKPSN